MGRWSRSSWLAAGLASLLLSAPGLAQDPVPCAGCARECVAHWLATYRGKGWIGADLKHADSRVGWVEVVWLIPEGPAARAGIERGDAIVAIDRVDLPGLKDFRAADAVLDRSVAGLKPGKPVRYTVVRGESRFEVVVTPTEISYHALAERIGRHLLSLYGYALPVGQ